MKKVAIVLLVIQVLALLGGLAGGSLERIFGGGIFMTLGYFAPAIIAVILLVVNAKKEK
ncbi:MAG: hypothetical protein Q4C50_02250 [Eubacteriales bacterium]|nr:hypothetical protein [Eubacteriales bacterium]